MSKPGSFLLFKLETKLLHEHDDRNFNTLLFGFTPSHTLHLPASYTHFGVIVEGRLKISYGAMVRELQAGDYFSFIGPAAVQSDGFGMISGRSRSSELV